MKCNTCGKMNCMAHGGSVKDQDHEKGVHARSYSRQGGGTSEAGNTLRDNAGMKRGGHFDKSEVIKDEHRRRLGESKAIHPKMKGLAHGGEVEDDKMDMYAMSPDVPAMHDEGGEIDDDMDQELNEMVADELLSAIEAKDKKGILESIRALVMNCGGK